MKKIITLLLCCVLSLSCMHDYLDYKPNKKLVVPSSYQDLRSILDHGTKMNSQVTPFLGELSADNYWVQDEMLNSGLLQHRAAYLWEDFVPETDGNWNSPFYQIFYANVVLERVDVLEESAKVALSDLQQLKGEAHFFRAWAYFQLSQLYCDPYNEYSKQESLGLPLRSEPDFNIKVERSKLEETYQMIIQDALTAGELMSDKSLVKTRPNRLAAYALLAKVYMQMHEYDEALLYADMILDHNDILLDYNNLDFDSVFPFSLFNEEVIWHCTMVASNLFSSRKLNIDTNLYALYEDGDLRKELFFNIDSDGLIKYKGSYSESEYEFFAGIALDEIYLIRAECYARGNNVERALTDLTALMSKRFRGNVYHKPDFLDGEELLGIIIQERRKELIFRGIRWHDLRRLNNDPRFASILKRNYQGKEYQLLPESRHYTLPIPMNEIELSGITQNDSEQKGH